MRAKIFTTDSDGLSLMTLVDSFLGAYAGHGWEFESLWIRFILSCIHDTPSRRVQDQWRRVLLAVYISLQRIPGFQSEGQNQRMNWGRKGSWGSLRPAMLDSY
jgi:hypothetical protein